MRCCDLIICRDVFIHLPNKTILKILKLFRQSGKLLLATSYDMPKGHNNYNRPKHPTKQHSKLDLSKHPFCLKEQRFTIPEDYHGKWSMLYEL